MQKVKVWDVFVRFSHWGLGLLVLGAFLTSEKDSLVAVHVKIGLAVLALVAARVFWGFVGPEAARFRAFVRGPREVLEYARSLVRGRPALHLSHNPLGGAMVVTLLVTLAALVATGAVVWCGPAFRGPLSDVLTRHDAKMVKEIHEALSGVLLGLVGAHVAGVLFSSWREGQNLVAGMITGRKLAPSADVHAPRPARAPRVVAAVLVGVAAVGIALAIGLPLHAHAAPPASATATAAALLRDYEAEARRARAGFSGFSAEEGRRLHLSTHVQDGQTVSCATCHTANPRATGLTPAGKVVDPLAPAANPARLGDRGEVEKWFKRNCKQVIGRECTAEEKGNFITWLLGA